MKRSLLFLTVALTLGLTGPGLRSQDAEPEPNPAIPAPEPIAPIAKGAPLEMLKAIRDANAKMLEQQAATLQKLEDLEKLSQILKTLGKRS